MRRIFLKAVVATVFIFVFFITTPFVSAFFAHYIVDTPPANFSIAPLQSVETELSVSIDPSYNQYFSSEEDKALYRIERRHSCEQYDEWGEECIDGVDLCPYLSIQPKNEEPSEVGFYLNASSPYVSAEGEINGVQDVTDKWNVSVTSPCFEDECPADYSYFINGAPLPQSSKGKTFTCNLGVYDNSPIFQAINIIGPEVAYAQTSPNEMTISAVLTGEHSQPATGYSNVLFIPGLEASRLYQGTVLNCQINCEDQLWEPNGNSDVEDLYLNEDGTSKYGFIYTRDIIKETNTPTPMGLAGQNIYKSFSNMMDGLTEGNPPDKMARWESYPYDWRQGVEDIVNNGTRYKDGKKSLITTLENLVASSTTGKVTIIAHSNGGLIAKALMVKLQEMKNAGTNNLVDKIDNIILVAVPQIGTASAVPAMLHGYEQSKLGGILMTKVRARELGRNMESAYGLLPSKEYINRISASPINFVEDTTESEVTDIFINTYGNVVDSYGEYVSFIMGNEGRVQPAVSATSLPIKLSSALYSRAETLHNKIDTWVPPVGIRVIEVAGWGLDTVASFEYYSDRQCGPMGLNGSIECDYFLDERPRFTIDGDKTVVVPSAQYMSSTTSNIEKYWVDIEKHNSELFLGVRRNREHKDILEVNSLNNMIKSVIQKTDIVFDTILKNTEPIDSKNRFRLSVHSPVTLGAYDPLGNFTGKVCPTGYDFCYVRDEIPNSSYLEFGEGKYLNLPEENMKKVVLEGTDIGTFTYESEKVTPGGDSVVVRFVDIPVTSQTTIEVSTNPVTQNMDMKIDTNSDGVIDITIQPNETFDPVTYLQVMRKTVENLDIIKARRNSFLNRIDATIKAIQKGKISKAKLKIERFENVLDKIISKKDPKKIKPHRLTKTEAEQLLLMLDTLLNNLNK